MFPMGTSRGVTGLGRAAACQLASACAGVTSLRAAGCPGLTLNAVGGFPALRELDLSGCDCIAPATAVRSPAQRPACAHMRAASAHDGLLRSLWGCRT